MATKRRTQSNKQPHTSERVLSAPGGILRRPPFVPVGSAANYATPIHDPRMNNNTIPSSYADVLPGGSMPQCISPGQNLQYPFYVSRDGTIPEDDSTNEDIEDQEEEEQITEVATTAENADVVGENVSPHEQLGANTDTQVEYVKSPGESPKSTGKKRSHRVTPIPGSVPKTMSHYDPKMVYNMVWQTPENTAAYQTQMHAGEANSNVVDSRIIENPNAYQPRKNPFPYQNTDPNKGQNLYNCSSPERNTDAWVKYQETLKKASQSHPPTSKATPKQKVQKPCVGADDSSKLEGIDQILGEMEYHEMSRIKKDLQDFQKARRRLIYDASNIKPLFYYRPKQ